MKASELKHKIEEDEKVKDYHLKRRMFCVYQDKLYIARPNLAYSHDEWFKKKGWTTGVDKLMDKVVRGIVNSDGDLHFYIGRNFKINNFAEKIFFSNLEKIVSKLKLSGETKIFGGAKKSKPGEKWPPLKKYGTIKNNLGRILCLK